jgi:hypothetical protein
VEEGDRVDVADALAGVDEKDAQEVREDAELDSLRIDLLADSLTVGLENGLELLLRRRGQEFPVDPSGR